MNLKLLNITILTLIPLVLLGQNQRVDLDWIENDSLLYFSKAIYPQEDGAIPFYSLTIPWESENSVPLVRVSVNASSPLDLKYLSSLPVKEFSETPGLSYSLVFEKGKPLLQISIMPFIQNSETGVTERVESFDISIDEELKLASLKYERKGSYVSSSLLASNNWYKIAVESTGIHKITYERLQEIGVQNPASVKIFGAGAILLPEDFSEGYYDDLKELPVYTFTGTDQLFGPGDYILFFAQGPVLWNFNNQDNYFMQKLHPYTLRGYYFITDGLGNAITPAAAPIISENSDITITDYDYIDYVEEESYNLLNSGREWYGFKFYGTLEDAFAFTLNNLVSNDTVKVIARAAGRSNELSFMKVRANATEIGELSFGTVDLSSYTSTHAIEDIKVFSFLSDREDLSVELQYLQPNSNSSAWLNSLTINARSRLVMDDNDLIFRDVRSVSPDMTGTFRIQNSKENTVIWDVTQPDNPLSVSRTISGATASFRAPLDELKEYVAFNPDGDFPEPVYASAAGRLPPSAAATPTSIRCGRSSLC